MLISQSWKETGNRKQEAGENLYSCLPFPASCLLSVITATLRGNKSDSIYRERRILSPSRFGKEIRRYGERSNDMKWYEILNRLRDYFEGREEVLMAFLFGSLAKGLDRPDSDMDIAVYLRPDGGGLQWDEPTARYEGEEEIWSDLERMLGRDIDLLVLNRASPTVSESALKGIPILIKDRGVYLDFLLRITSEAIDFREWMESYWKLKERLRRVARR